MSFTVGINTVGFSDWGGIWVHQRVACSMVFPAQVHQNGHLALQGQYRWCQVPQMLPEQLMR
jgi:hypothetical protein